ncbi:hypothetical protein BH09BAC1_BH09BAC1_26490 [soil metagenome]
MGPAVLEEASRDVFLSLSYHCYTNWTLKYYLSSKTFLTTKGTKKRTTKDTKKYLTFFVILMNSLCAPCGLNAQTQLVSVVYNINGITAIL